MISLYIARIRKYDYMIVKIFQLCNTFMDYGIQAVVKVRGSQGNAMPIYRAYTYVVVVVVEFTLVTSILSGVTRTVAYIK